MKTWQRCYLLGGKTDYVVGETIVVDGGWSTQTSPAAGTSLGLDVQRQHSPTLLDH